MKDQLELVRRLRAMSGPITPNLVTEAADTIERLVRERDEARRMYCRTVWIGVGDEEEPRRIGPKGIARIEGWDCYAEANG